jgi:hypothetical protein
MIVTTKRATLSALSGVPGFTETGGSTGVRSIGHSRIHGRHTGQDQADLASGYPWRGVPRAAWTATGPVLFVTASLLPKRRQWARVGGVGMLTLLQWNFKLVVSHDHVAAEMFLHAFKPVPVCQRRDAGSSIAEPHCMRCGSGCFCPYSGFCYGRCLLKSPLRAPWRRCAKRIR